MIAPDPASLRRVELLYQAGDIARFWTDREGRIWVEDEHDNVECVSDPEDIVYEYSNTARSPQ